MSESVFTPVNETHASFNRWDIPIKMGVLLGLLSILLATVNNMLILPHNYIAYLVFTFAMGIGMVVLYGVAGARQRKAMGGFISLKDAFSAIFVVILISSAIGAVYNLIYAKWIDPHVGEKIKEGTLSMMERFKVPQSKLDEASTNFDRQLAESQKPSQVLLGYFKGLILLSIFGFIAALIVRRVPKTNMQ